MNLHAQSAMLEQQLQNCCMEADGPLQTVCLHALAGGRRTRGMLLLHAAERTDTTALHAACAVELLHAATLLQDDIFDGSMLRRGRKAAHVEFGKAQAILASDWLLLRALELSAEVHLSFFRALASASKTMTLSVARELDPPLLLDGRAAESYVEQMCKGKTSTLFVATLHAAALLRGGIDLREWVNVGDRAGCTYQLLDDCLDLYAPSGSVDKATGVDLHTGRLTKPLLMALQQLRSSDYAVHMGRFTTADMNAVELERMESAIGSEEVRNRLKRYAASELESLVTAARAAAIPETAITHLEQDMCGKLTLCFGTYESKELPDAHLAYLASRNK